LADAYARPTHRAAGNRPERCIRASSPQRVRVARDSEDIFSRASDVATRQRLDARPATGKKRRPISRPQHPRPSSGTALVYCCCGVGNSGH
jgi:hypothetical protein